MAAEKELTPADICKAAAFNLYRNGSDARQQKNGNPDNLVVNCLTSKTITTIGVYKYYLSAEQRQIVNDNKNTAPCLKYEFITAMCQAVLKAIEDMYEYKSDKDVKVFVNIPNTQQLEMLQAAAAGKFDLYKEKTIVNTLSPRKMFIFQERQKVTDN